MSPSKSLQQRRSLHWPVFTGKHCFAHGLTVPSSWIVAKPADVHQTFTKFSNIFYVVQEPLQMLRHPRHQYSWRWCAILCSQDGYLYFLTGHSLNTTVDRCYSYLNRAMVQNSKCPQQCSLVLRCAVQELQPPNFTCGQVNSKRETFDRPRLVGRILDQLELAQLELARLEDCLRKCRQICIASANLRLEGRYPKNGTHQWVLQ